MRASSQTRLSDRRRALVEQASVALRGHLVALWRLTGGQAVAELVSRPGLYQKLHRLQFRLAESQSIGALSGLPGAFAEGQAG